MVSGLHSYPGELCPNTEADPKVGWLKPPNPVGCPNPKAGAEVVGMVEDASPRTDSLAVVLVPEPKMGD